MSLSFTHLGTHLPDIEQMIILENTHLARVKLRLSHQSYSIFAHSCNLIGQFPGE